MPLWPLWIQQWMNALAELFVQAGLPWPAALAMAGAAAAAIVATLRSS